MKSPNTARVLCATKPDDSSAYQDPTAHRRQKEADVSCCTRHRLLLANLLLACVACCVFRTKGMAKNTPFRTRRTSKDLKTETACLAFAHFYLADDAAMVGPTQTGRTTSRSSTGSPRPCQADADIQGGGGGGGGNRGNLGIERKSIFEGCKAVEAKLMIQCYPLLHSSNF